MNYFPAEKNVEKDWKKSSSLKNLVDFKTILKRKECSAQIILISVWVKNNNLSQFFSLALNCFFSENKKLRS